MHPNRILKDNLSDYSVFVLLKRFSNLILSETRQKTARIIFFTLSSKIVAHVLAMVAGIIIARQLGPEGKGILAAVVVVPTFIASFGHFGLPVSNIYYIGKGKDIGQLFSNSIIFLLIASLLYFTASLVFLPVLNKSYFSGLSSVNISIVVLLLIPFLLAKHFFIDILRGIEKYNEFNYSNVIQHGSRFLLIVFFLLIYGLTVKLALLAMFAALFIANCYCFVIIKKQISLSISRVNWLQFKKNLSFGLREYLGNLFATLNIKIDLLILAAFMDKSLIGIYSVAVALSELFQFVPSSISVVLLPKVAKSSAAHSHKILKKSIVSNTIILSFGWFFFILTGWWLIPFLYGDAFKAAYFLSIIILFGTILMSLTQIINKYFSGVGRPELKSIIRAINIPIKAISMYFLIKYYGLEGAAWSFVVTTLSLLLITFIFYAKEKKRVSITA
jgi:O-antigen/teichoic acid export membrane protein